MATLVVTAKVVVRGARVAAAEEVTKAPVTKALGTTVPTAASPHQGQAIIVYILI
jgi:hypothetical protein